MKWIRWGSLSCKRALYRVRHQIFVNVYFQEYTDSIYIIYCCIVTAIGFLIGKGTRRDTCHKFATSNCTIGMSTKNAFFLQASWLTCKNADTNTIYLPSSPPYCEQQQPLRTKETQAPRMPVAFDQSRPLIPKTAESFWIQVRQRPDESEIFYPKPFISVHQGMPATQYSRQIPVMNVDSISKLVDVIMIRHLKSHSPALKAQRSLRDHGCDLEPHSQILDLRRPVFVGLPSCKARQQHCGFVLRIVANNWWQWFVLCPV